MFKRITKRQEKRERDEELGLDDDAKQMFGMQDTDSDESDTDSDSDSASSEEQDDKSGAGMRTEWLAAEGADTEDEDGTDEEGLNLEEEAEDEPPMSLEEAINDPIYLVSMGPDVRACIICPKKLLKNTKMVDTHVQSAGHGRRFKKFCELAQSRNYRFKDPRRIVAIISEQNVKTDDQRMSNRGLKRKEKLEAIKAKREKKKKIIERKKRKRAEKENESKNDDVDNGADTDHVTAERPKKRRKVSKHQDTHDREKGSGAGADVDTKTQAKHVKSSKGKASRKTKSISKTSEDNEGTTEVGSEQTPEGKQANGKVNKDVSAIDKGAKSPKPKKCDSTRMEAKGRMHKTRKFAIPSDTGAVKDKSIRGTRTGEERGVHKSKSQRYFDIPEVKGNKQGKAPKDLVIFD